MQCRINSDDNDKSCDKPALDDSDNGYCVEHEIEYLKWCIMANRARITELEQIPERNKLCQDQETTTKVST